MRKSNSVMKRNLARLIVIILSVIMIILTATIKWVRIVKHKEYKNFRVYMQRIITSNKKVCAITILVIVKTLLIQV